MAPGTLAFTWLGHAGRQAIDGDAAAIRYGLLALGVLAAIAFVPRIVGRLRGDGTTTSWIEVEELVRLLADKRRLTIIDVRSPADFRAARAYRGSPQPASGPGYATHCPARRPSRTSRSSSSAARTKCPPLRPPARAAGFRMSAWCAAAWSSGTSSVCRSLIGSSDGEHEEAIMKALFIFNDPPYGTERVYNGLRLAPASPRTIPRRKSPSS